MRKKMFTCLVLICLSIGAMAQSKPGVDTSKAKAPEVFFLIGDLSTWQLLYKAVATPMDVTPNQQSALMDWINKRLQAVPVDSTKKK